MTRVPASSATAPSLAGGLRIFAVVALIIPCQDPGPR
jgi:hypothetical protein